MYIVQKNILKVAKFLDHLSYNVKRLWDIEQNMYIDKQTNGVQYKHKDNICITYKIIGDIFQDNAIY